MLVFAVSEASIGRKLFSAADELKLGTVSCKLFSYSVSDVELTFPDPPVNFRFSF